MCEDRSKEETINNRRLFRLLRGEKYDRHGDLILSEPGQGPWGVENMMSIRACLNLQMQQEIKEESRRITSKNAYRTIQRNGNDSTGIPRK